MVERRNDNSLLDGRSYSHEYGTEPAHVAKLKSMLARSYSDDNNLQRGALSVPRIVSRPGSCDDGNIPQGLFAGIRAVL